MAKIQKVLAHPFGVFSLAVRHRFFCTQTKEMGSRKNIFPNSPIFRRIRKNAYSRKLHKPFSISQTLPSEIWYSILVRKMKQAKHVNSFLNSPLSFFTHRAAPATAGALPDQMLQSPSGLCSSRLRAAFLLPAGAEKAPRCFQQGAFVFSLMFSARRRPGGPPDSSGACGWRWPPAWRTASPGRPRQWPCGRPGAGSPAPR